MDIRKSIAMAAVVLTSTMIYTDENQAIATGVAAGLAVRRACLDILFVAYGPVGAEQQLYFCFGDLRYQGPK